MGVELVFVDYISTVRVWRREAGSTVLALRSSLTFAYLPKMGQTAEEICSASIVEMGEPQIEPFGG